MKKKIIISILVLAIILIGIFAYRNINGTITVNSCLMRINYMSEEYNGSIEELKSVYDEQEEDYLVQKVRKNNIFPSDDIRDYVNVGISMDLKNNSVLGITDITGFLIIDDENSIIISKDGSLVSENIEGNDQKNTYLMGLLIYKGNMTDEDIEKYISNLQIEIYYKNMFNSHLSKIVHMSDISIELDVVDWNEQKGEGL